MNDSGKQHIYDYVYGVLLFINRNSGWGNKLINISYVKVRYGKYFRLELNWVSAGV